MSTSTPPDAVVEAIKEDFHTYLRKGVRIERIVGESHADLDIEDIESLLKTHFVLTEEDPPDVGVVDFVDRLYDRIRRVKTETTGKREDIHGAIRGTVDWHQSAKRRSRIGRTDAPLYVCIQQETNYNIEENLVLKRLLTVIRDILENELEPALDEPSGYGWLGYWHPAAKSDAEPPHEQLVRLYEENVYLQRVEVEDTDITHRMIESVKRSRSRLYRDAAELLDRYRRLMRHELTDEEARQVLDHTMIRPKADDTLFELYWIFRLLNSFGDVTYRVIRDDTKSVVASWEGEDSTYRLYHDVTGDHLTFREDLGRETVEEDGYLFRMQAVLHRWQELSEHLLNRGGSESLWGGRPDIVLERLPPDEEPAKASQVFVGEVKYTNSQDYAATGLRELLEYMAFVRHSSDTSYIEKQDTILEAKNVHGLLFVDQVDKEVDSNEPINIIEFGEKIPPLFG